MKKYLLIIFIFVGVALAGCSKNVPSNPDITPAQTPLIYVHGMFMQNDAGIKAEIYLSKGSNVHDNPISQATVRIDYVSIEESATTGKYEANIAGNFSEGATLNISVNTNTGNAYSAVIVPEKAVVAMPVNNSIIRLGDIIQYKWTCEKPENYTIIHVKGNTNDLYITGNKISPFLSSTDFLNAESSQIYIYNVKSSPAFNDLINCGSIEFANSGNSITVQLIN